MVNLFDATDLTNEEKRVPIYSNTDSPILSNQVNFDTPLESLNLNWKEKDLREKEQTPQKLIDNT